MRYCQNIELFLTLNRILKPNYHFCKTVENTAYFHVSHTRKTTYFIRERKCQQIEESLVVTLLNCENRQVVSALAGFIGSITFYCKRSLFFLLPFYKG